MVPFAMSLLDQFRRALLRILTVFYVSLQQVVGEREDVGSLESAT